jgi:di/tricarboxylate transporter
MIDYPDGVPRPPPRTGLMQSILLAIIIVVALALIFTNRLRADLVAILVMLVLPFAGLITFEDALDGFSNSAVVTILAMFIVSRGLDETGIIQWISEQIRRLSRGRELWLVLITMGAGIILVQFMNIVAAGAILMPAARFARSAVQGADPAVLRHAGRRDGHDLRQRQCDHEPSA